MPGIIVGVDGSVHSDRALEWAMKEAAIRREPLTVISVAQALTTPWGPTYYPGDEVRVQQARQAVEEAVEKAQATLADTGPASIIVKAVIGIPAEVILSAAEDTDMIVVGSRGSGGFARLLLGSVSSQITHHAHCPVVVVPPEDRG
jgi:nucleotide-binding universal stress UspA family protein